MNPSPPPSVGSAALAGAQRSPSVSIDRLFVCYVPGLDARRVNADWTPFIDSLAASGPRVTIGTLPNTELLPTMVTGVYPHDHGVWQVRLRDGIRDLSRRRPIDLLPEVVGTTLQCVRQHRDASYDLATVPARRRRRFEMHRFKYTRRQNTDEPLRAFGRIPSIFGLLEADARYEFTKSFAALPELAERLPSGSVRLEFLEMYALDLFQHWNLDQPDRMRDAYRRTDVFVRRVHERCRKEGVGFLLLVDHGQEQVVGTIPLRRALAKTGLSDSEHTFFIELALARFWFHSDRARRRVLDRLQSIPHATLLTWRQMHDFHVGFPDSSHGDVYLAADAGYIFFPHDFYHPLASAYLGLTDRNQRRRILHPVHRGNHGYLPHFPSERGWAVLAEPAGFEAVRPEIELIDVAPTILGLLGRPTPDHMRGRLAFGR